ncbi:hypothetical protein M419DRAFT_72754 [Trichoderma reesei RUT C-30]|uniref:Uncharacterized protein n=1 Tax=Hypocrea jecorina (strain ATCC 56765 / BCRC 32924 / NRRL 11460 / Rut C-30) TaxID=1344414 RepID=A0A024SFX0_HYPJR|nr:hypothetical protein M419DRAFT_72754 [Trichoderma reesei RUT C-30]
MANKLGRKTEFALNGSRRGACLRVVKPMPSGMLRANLVYCSRSNDGARLSVTNAWKK